MPPIIMLLLRFFTLVLIIIKTTMGLIASLKNPKTPGQIKNKTYIQIFSSISIFFSVYFLLLSAASTKGALIFGTAQTLHEVIAFFLFTSSAIADIALILYTAGPQKMAKFVKTILCMIVGFYVLLIIVYIIAVYRIGIIVKSQMARDTLSVNFPSRIGG